MNTAIANNTGSSSVAPDFKPHVGELISLLRGTRTLNMPEQSGALTRDGALWWERMSYFAVLALPPANISAFVAVIDQDAEWQQRQIERNQAAIQLALARRDQEDEVTQREELERFMAALDEDRAEYRKLFS